MSTAESRQVSDQYIQTLRMAVSGEHKDKDQNELYRIMAPMYDQAKGYYIGPAVTVQELKQVLGGRRNVRIMDLAAGTGLVGEELLKNGFLEIDALDPSTEMLDIAKSKNIYQNLYCDYIGSTNLTIREGSYDAITLVGAIAPNHVTDDCFEELLRICKPGGYIVIATSEKHMFQPEMSGFDPHMKELEEAGQWKLLIKKRVERYTTFYGAQSAGVVYVLQKAA